MADMVQKKFDASENIIIKIFEVGYHSSGRYYDSANCGADVGRDDR